jgi:hypothetical protein
MNDQCEWTHPSGARCAKRPHTLALHLTLTGGIPTFYRNDAVQVERAEAIRQETLSLEEIRELQRRWPTTELPLRSEAIVTSAFSVTPVHSRTGRAKRTPDVPDPRALGYTGSMCPTCSSMRMVRSGTCETCEVCFTAGSCG